MKREDEKIRDLKTYQRPHVGPDVTSEIEWVTEQAAELLLAANARNRPLSERVVKALSHAMRQGEWRFTDESIKVDDQGQLIDGQHRLSAVVRTGMPQWMRVTRGLESRAFDVLDRGKRRTTADVMATRGYAEWTALASTASWLNRLISHEGRPPNIQMSSVEALGIVEAFPSAHMMIKAVKKYRVSRLLRTTGLPTAICVIAVGAEVTSVPPVMLRFLERLGEGVGLEREDAELHLRSRMLDRDDIPPLKDRAVGLIRAWNFYVTGKKCRHLVLALRSSPRHEERFPEILECPQGGDNE